MSDTAERLRHTNDALLTSGQDYSDVLLDAAAENERLRNLLREGLQIDAGDFSVNVDEWIKRVRKVLDDSP